MFFRRPAADSNLPPMQTVRLTSFPGEEYDPALSFDGNSVAFSWNGPDQDNFDIYVKLVDAGNPLRLTTDPAGDYRPAWSPDGRYIVFIRPTLNQRNELYLIPALGGGERKLADLEPQFSSSVCWSADSKFILISNRAGSREPFCIFKLSVVTLKMEQLTKSPSQYFGDHTPRLSPDQKTLAFVRLQRSGSCDVYLRSSRTGETKQLTFDRLPISGMAWTKDSREIVLSSSRDGVMRLWRVSVSDGAIARLPLGGESAKAPSLSTMQYRLAYSQSSINVNIWQVERTDPAKSRLLISSTQQDHFPQFSPDGKRIAFSSDRSGSFEVWVCDRDGKNPLQLTELYDAFATRPRWSPDGKQIAFSSQASGSYTLYLINADGGKSRPITQGDYAARFPSWSRDGRWVYFSSNQTGIYQIWKVPAQGGEAVQVTRSGGVRPLESEDAKFIYYHKRSPEDDTFPCVDIWKMPVAGGDESLVLEKIGAARSGAGEFVFSSWELGKNGIYFTKMKTESKGRIEFSDFVIREKSTVAFLKPGSISFGLALSSDENQILYTHVEWVQGDIMLVENFR